MTYNDTPRKEQRPRATRWLHGIALLSCALGAAACSGHGGSGASAALRLNAIEPANGPFIGGTPVTLHGARFLVPGGGPTAVTIGGAPCTDVAVLDDGTLTCLTPAGTPGMLVDVVVTNDNGLGRLDDGFAYDGVAAPQSDLNGDGIADFVVAAPLDGSVGAQAGAVYVFFGSEGLQNLADRTAADADLCFLGQNVGDRFGLAVCTGDVNGDGLADVCIGAPRHDVAAAQDCGAVYSYYGPFAAGAPLAALDADVKLLGETLRAGDQFGTALDLHDVTSDDVADLMVAAPMHDDAAMGTNPAGQDRGCVYVFGGGQSYTSIPAGSAAYTFGGTARDDRLAAAVTSADLDGDGLKDLVLGVAQFDPVAPVLLADAGAVFVFFGGAGMQSGAATTAQSMFTGEQPGDAFGAVLTAADVDGDGQEDLIVSAPKHDRYEADGGAVYVFLGGPGFAGRSAAQADAAFHGMATHNSLGKSLRAADVNGDSIADLVVGAPHADYLNDGNGRVYVFHGRPGLSGAVAVEADAIFNGENAQDDALGTAVSIADFNGDYYIDLIMSATRNSIGAGRVYAFLSPTTGVHMAQDADVRYSGALDFSLFGSAIAEGH